MTIIASETVVTDFWNLKNKATGPRRYGFIGTISHDDREGYRAGYCATYQTTLDGERYQSSKSTCGFATAAEAEASLKRTIAGAIKRYHRLAQDPASRIEYRTPLAAATTCKIADAADKAKAIEKALHDRFPGLKDKLIVI
jgi:hypothetical protein